MERHNALIEAMAPLFEAVFYVVAEAIWVLLESL